jgi:putative transcriptional regulator
LVTDAAGEKLLPSRRGVVTNDPKYHLPDQGLVEHATGIGSEAAGLAVDCHLVFCGRCRGELAASREGLALMVEGLPGVSTDPAGRQRLLEKLGDPRPPAAPVVPADLTWLPGPLHAHLARSARWRMLVPGARAIDLPVADHEATARVIRFRPGFVIPLHDHAGPEYTVIFSGRLKDGGEIAGPGDVVYREPGIKHIQTITDEADCVALVVNERPLVPLTLRGRLLRFIAGV